MATVADLAFPSETSRGVEFFEPDEGARISALDLWRFFHDWGKLLSPALVPGAHVCVAGHPILQPLV